MKKLSLVLLVLLMALPAPLGVKAVKVATITVSGTVTGPGGVVSGAQVNVISDDTEEITTTASDGSYSVSIPSSSFLMFLVRADGLADINMFRDGVSGNITQNFTMETGYTLRVQVNDQHQQPVPPPLWLEVQPLIRMMPENRGYQLEWHDGPYYFANLHPDIYYVTINEPPDGYYATTQAYDLRTGDATVTLPLNTAFVPPIPYEPPDATKITVDAPDLLGEATVTGAPGAAMPLARVLLVNTFTAHQSAAVSEADGSFSARIYAPPGSALMVKHGPANDRWMGLETGIAEGINPFPGTIINVPPAHTATAPGQPFAAVGAGDVQTDDKAETGNYVGSAWALTGVMEPVVAEGTWTRVLTGTYAGEVTPGLYLGGFNWTHPALADMDDDGDLDLVVGEEQGKLRFYRNKGTSTAPDWQFESDNFAGVDTNGWAYPALGDLTGDGAPDLVVGAGGGSVTIYYNTGTPAAPAWPATPDVTLTSGGNAAPTLEDINGDGDVDLFVGHQGGDLYYFENTGSASVPTWTARGSGYGSISESGEGVQPAFFDLDGDSDRDLLLGLCGSLVWYRREGASWTRQSGDPLEPPGYGGSCAVSPGVGDWSGDGKPDLVIGEHWGRLSFYRSAAGNSWEIANFAFPIELGGGSAPALADWDDDGTLDMVIGQVHGQVLQYHNEGTASAPDWSPQGELLALPWTNHPHAFPTFADVDGDDDRDLFIGEGGWPEGSGMGGNIHHYRNEGTTATPNWTLVVTDFLGLDVGGWSTPVFVDIDNDNDHDLFVGSETGPLTFVEYDGGWQAPVSDYAGLNPGPYSAPAFCDVDEDGDLDMLVGLGSGTLAYVRNTGSASAPAWELVTTSYKGINVGDHAVPATADIDGDGDDDLLIGNGAGGLHVYRNEGVAAHISTSQAASYAPGDEIQLRGELRFHSHAITATTAIEDISAFGHFLLYMLNAEAGRPLPFENSFMSSLLTPGGQPIQSTRRSYLGNVERDFTFENFAYVGGHTLAAPFTTTFRIPLEATTGVYRPLLMIFADGIPTSTTWVAANVTGWTYWPEIAPLPPLRVASSPDGSGAVNQEEEARLIWRLLNDNYSEGTRGTGAREDAGVFNLASQIVTQGAPYHVPPTDPRTGASLIYRLEPFMPHVSATDRRIPGPPLLPFDLPGGALHVLIQEPDGNLRDLGSEAFAQSFNRTPTTRGGADLNIGTTQQDDVYSLMAASDRFRVTFDQYGHHVITMTGQVDDLWGNTYTGGGVYDVWVAQPLDVRHGVMPGTPLEVNDTFNPALRIFPRVPAQVKLTFTLYPESDPSRAIVHTLSGQANAYGYFNADCGLQSPCQGAKITREAPGSAPQTVESITMEDHGEYRVDLTAIYTDTEGTLYFSARTWGGVVMTPPSKSPQLIAHGRRGVDSLLDIPGSPWFILCEDLTIPPGVVTHTFNPYFNGDVIWSRIQDAVGECPAGVTSGGDSLLVVASVQDTVGNIQNAITTRANRMGAEVLPPGDLSERVAANELPLFSSTRSGRAVQLSLGKIGAPLPADVDQIAYSYRSSQRPGVRVRELVAEDSQTGGYWRLDTLYDDQQGVGIQGDQPNDFKYQFVGTVYRDMDTGHAEYGGQGTGWLFIPTDDARNNRVMPPFAGYGPWTAEGGPLLTLKGEDIHIFILPTGVGPGEVLELGDRFSFAGHVMPTLDSQVAVTVTAPGGRQHFVGGQANEVGYFYDPDDDFSVLEAGLWTVDVRVWHEGQCCGGLAMSPPYPEGDVLGSQSGRYVFYVVPRGNSRLNVQTPQPGYLSFAGAVTPITVTGTLPAGLANATVDYTIDMPGYILERGQATLSGDSYQVVYDPVKLRDDYPNLDLIGRDDHRAGLADTVAINLLLQGEREGQLARYANAVTIQGQQVYVDNLTATASYGLYLPLVLRK